MTLYIFCVCYVFCLFVFFFLWENRYGINGIPSAQLSIQPRILTPLGSNTSRQISIPSLISTSAAQTSNLLVELRRRGTPFSSAASMFN